MKKKTFVLGILVFTLVSLSWGQAPAPVGVRGLDLLYTCRDAKQDSYFHGLCNGMLYASSTLIREQCPSSGATFEIEKKVVISYLENHPEQLDQLDLLLIKKALVEAYPCSDKKVRDDTSNATGARARIVFVRPEARAPKVLVP
jgi:Ssp1 endopeptidase immunity protein Rap1a